LEGERELIRGFNIEMGSLIFVYLFLREYGIVIIISLITNVVLTGRVGLVGVFLVIIMLLLRSCFPRVRYDSLMSFMWQSVLPFRALIVFFNPFLIREILREILTIFRVVIISGQSSSLISRLMLVFFRIGVIFLVRVNLVYSGFLCYIFIMIFIGGLMVLLVSVASTVPQEQGVSFIPYLVSLIIINLFLWV